MTMLFISIFAFLSIDGWKPFPPLAGIPAITTRKGA
jgi:hypothetical protein